MTLTTKIGFGAKVQGVMSVFGGSGEQANTHHLDSSFAGKIVVVLSFVGREFLEKAGLVEVAGVIVPSMHLRDFEYLRGRNEFPLLILTKFGRLELSGDLKEKLSKLDGKKAVLDGDCKTLTV